MLIMPLHRRLTRANFPLVTFSLLALNLIVFFALQWGDHRILQQAASFYFQSQLGQVEFPAYRDWLAEHATDPHRLALMERGPAAAKLALIEADPAFLAALHADTVIRPEHARYAEWKAGRSAYESMRDRAFTLRHALRYSHIEPGRMLWAMFMHGGVSHLVGNMVFLLMLGLLVEGALGAWRYLGLYLLGGCLASAASLALHWGETGLMLGASGAIAALMGAYCVLWGRRKVRVFYWFFVVCDYVRVPALALLPLWLGWQLFKLLTDTDGQVAFGAHAAGILAGALFALLLKRTGHVRQDFIEADEQVDLQAGHEADFDLAMQHLGTLEIAPARRLLEGIDAAEPGQLRVLAALYRCARYGGTAQQLDAAAARALALPVTQRTDVRELAALYADYLQACSGTPRLPPATLLRLAPMWLRAGETAATEALLRSLDQRAAHLPALAAAWFTLALKTAEGTSERRLRLEHLARHFPGSPYATKARLLLQGD